MNGKTKLMTVNFVSYFFKAPVVNSGYVPVLHGDTILADLESGKGTIISGDQLVLDLVKFYQVSVSHVVFLSSVPGVLSKSSNIIPVIYSSVLFNDKNNILNDFDNKEVDVTGAMQSKIKVAIEIANICDVFIVGLSSYSLLELNDIICRRKHVAGTLIKKQNKE